ncbi:hypothetical protein A8924_6708 [Saccharopolyspora erythraea NRRL 2338]|uniref:Uncharacterized protein n=1 Tax=Saccharopolyspora erythraea TaxID=1836 RepID=A0ABP3MZF5_SACER|nr:hypothetical protein [Saccharopolyspora erythraea]PFG99170.1 hypothetical protein A8924_6708 [Saccharopolyspora erythraea NRRL 2338]
MPPWSSRSPWGTRTLQAAVVAAGVTAVGGGAVAIADGGQATPPSGPELTRIPEQVELAAPIDGCKPQDVSAKTCVDAVGRVVAPTLVHQAGADLGQSRSELGSALRVERPLVSFGKAQRALDAVQNTSHRAQELGRTRPTTQVGLWPDNIGPLHKQTADGVLFDAELAPRPPDHEGVSALDTVSRLDAAHGYGMRPATVPVGTVMPLARQAPGVDPLLTEVNTRGNALAKTYQRIAPAPQPPAPAVPPSAAPASERQTPALPSLDSTLEDAVVGSAHNVATGLPQSPSQVTGLASAAQ